MHARKVNLLSRIVSSRPEKVSFMSLYYKFMIALPPLEKYACLQRDGHERLTGYVEASRGCLHLCLHCPIPSVYGGRFFVVPKPIVLEDIRGLVRAGAEHITYGDPDFLNGPKHSLGIVRAMHDEFPDLSFDITTKVEHILKHAAIMPELVAQGCAFVVSAVESLSDMVLAHLEKGHNRADVFRALEILRSCGIPLRPSLVSFTPWTTLDDYLDVLDFVDAQGLIDCVDPVHYTIRLLVPPGSGLLSRPAIQPFLTGLDQTALTYRWTHPDPIMHRLYENVSALVEEASRVGEDAADTFQRVRDLAFGMHENRRPARETSPLRPDRSRPPSAVSVQDSGLDTKDSATADGFLVENFLAGPEVALEGLLSRGRLRVLALFVKPDPLDGPFFEETIYVTPSRLPTLVQHEVAERACQAIGLAEGPVHAELRVSTKTTHDLPRTAQQSGGPCVIEVNARSIGGLCSRVLRFGTGISLEELIIRHALHPTFSPPAREGQASGVMMIPIPRAGVLREVRGLAAARDVAGIEDVTISSRVGQELVPLPEGGLYLGFLLSIRARRGTRESRSGAAGRPCPA